MKNYSLKRKKTIQKKLLPPHNLSVSYLAKKEGISKTTLYRWRNEALTLALASNPTNVIKQLQQENRYLKQKLSFKNNKILCDFLLRILRKIIKIIITIYLMMR